MQGTGVWSLSQEDPLEEGMATHSSIFAWRIPWTEEPGRFIVHSVTKSWTQLKWLSMHTHRQACIRHSVITWSVKEKWFNHVISAFYNLSSGLGLVSFQGSRTGWITFAWSPSPPLNWGYGYFSIKCIIRTLNFLRNEGKIRSIVYNSGFWTVTKIQNKKYTF